jgi:hypothetical protein
LNKRLLYRKAYRLLGDLTPLKTDCGALCGKACCKGDENTGMYLYPGEEEMYGSDDGFISIKMIDLNIHHAACAGKCRRSLRPLACRIFPLIPYLHEGALDIIKDPRAMRLCPLLNCSQAPGMDSLFIKKVREVFRLLLEDADIRAFVEFMSDEISPYIKLTDRIKSYQED